MVKQTVSDKVKKIIEKNNLSGKSLSVIANEEGIDVFELDMSDISRQMGIEISGLIRKSGDTYNIYIEKSDKKTRKRFTFAHELGHYFMHRKELDKDGLIYDIIKYRGSIHDIHEEEANEFAAQLLMPEDIVRKAAAIDNDVEVLANFFNVSRSAMAFRLDNLKL